MSTPRKSVQPKILVVDVGGSHIKCLLSGDTTRRKFKSGPKLTPQQMVAGILKITADWRFDALSIGYPGVVTQGAPALEPHHLAPGWVGFDFEEAFGLPVRIVNDAAMQALGSYRGGKMLFLGLGLGLGTGLGSAPRVRHCIKAAGIGAINRLFHSGGNNRSSPFLPFLRLHDGTPGSGISVLREIQISV